MTVGEFRAALAKIPDRLEVVLYVDDGWGSPITADIAAGRFNRKDADRDTFEIQHSDDMDDPVPANCCILHMKYRP
jgi:hypothetical protein